MSTDQEESVERWMWARRLGARVGAWQPFTGKGLAAFSVSSSARAIVFHALFVVLTSGVVGWTLYWAWFPAIQKAVDMLPESHAAVSHGRFLWPTDDARVLGETPQFAVAVDPQGRSDIGQSADLQLEFHAREFRIQGLVGFVSFSYPDPWNIPLDRVAGRSAWLAWNGAFLTAGVVLTGVIGLVGGWTMALILAGPVWLLAYLTMRELTFAGAWRMNLVSWIPGAVVFNLGLWGYSWNWLRVAGVLGAAMGHLVIPMIWIIWAIASLPGKGAREPDNPFAQT